MNVVTSLALFWIGAAVILACALAWVLRPLFTRASGRPGADRRELNLAVCRDEMCELEEARRAGELTEDEWHSARAELVARLARDTRGGPARFPSAAAGPRRLGLLLAVLSPALALGLYLATGEPGHVLERAAAEEAGRDRDHQVAEALARLEEQVGQALETLERNVEENPEDGVAWVYLANAYIARERWPEAEAAWARAHAVLPGEALVLSGYAEALAVNAGRDLDGRPIELVREALVLDPEDPKALELAGIHAFQNRNYSTAGYYWNQLLRLTPEDTPAHAELAAMVRRARSLGHVEAFGEEPPGGEAAGTVSGRVELSEELAGRAQPEDTVFLLAQTATGRPLAALRTRLDELPVEFTLDDSLAVDPEQVLSNYESITLIARVSRDGSRSAHPGDLEGRLEEVPVGSAGLRLVIDTVRP